MSIFVHKICIMMLTAFLTLVSNLKIIWYRAKQKADEAEKKRIEEEKAAEE